MHLASGIGIPHGHWVVDEHEFDLERLAARGLPDLSGLEAVVGEDDRTPAGPDIEREADGVVLQRLVGARALHRRQFLGRLEGVFLHRGRHSGIARLEEHAFSPGGATSRPTSGPRHALTTRWPIATADRPTAAGRRLTGSSVPATTGRSPQPKLVEHASPPGSERYKTKNDGPHSKPERSLGLASHETPLHVREINTTEQTNTV